MSTAARLIAAGKAHSKPWISVSKTAAPTSYLDARKLWAPRITDAVRAQHLTQAAPQFLFPAEDGKIVVFTCVRDSAEEEHKVLGVIGDDVFDTQHVTIHEDTMKGAIAGPVSPTDANVFEIPISTTMTDMLSTPPDPDDNNSRTLHAVATLDFGGATACKVGAVQAFLPVPVGQELPPDLEWAKTYPQLTADWPEFEVWRKLVAYLCSKNGGVSLSRGDKILLGNEIDPAGFQGATILHDIAPEFTAVIMGPLKEEVQKSWALELENVFLRLGDKLSMLPPVPAGGGPGVGGGGGSPNNGIAEFTEALTNMVKPASLKDQEAVSNGISQQAGLGAMPAHVGKDDDANAETSVTAKILPAAAKLFKMSANRVTSEHQKLHEENLVALQSADNMGKTINADITHCKQDLTSFFSQAIRDNDWTNDSLDSPNCKPKLALNSIVFGCRRTDSIQCTQLLDDDQLFLKQIASDEHASKRAARTSEPAVDVSLDTDHDMLALSSNIRSHCTAFVSEKDCDESFAGVFLRKVGLIMASQQGRVFFATHRSREVIFAIAVAVDDFFQHLSKFANRSTLRQSATDDKEIDVDVFAQVSSCSDFLLTPIQGAIQRNAPGDLSKPSFGCNMFCGRNNNNNNNHGNDDKRRGANPDRGDRNKLPKQSGPDGGPITKGFLVWSGDGAPPSLDIKWKKSDGVMAAICTPFVCRGAFCPNRQCPQHHVFNPKSMPEDKRKQSAKQVSSAPHLECVPGFAPAGAP